MQSLTVILLSIISILYQKKNRKKFSRRKKWPKLRYSFNFSESTTRCRADQKQKMSPIKAVFLQSRHPSFTVGISLLLYLLRTSEVESMFRNWYWKIGHIQLYIVVNAQAQRILMIIAKIGMMISSVCYHVIKNLTPYLKDDKLSVLLDLS